MLRAVPVYRTPPCSDKAPVPPDVTPLRPPQDQHMSFSRPWLSGAVDLVLVSHSRYEPMRMTMAQALQARPVGDGAPTPEGCFFGIFLIAKIERKMLKWGVWERKSAFVFEDPESSPFICHTALAVSTHPRNVATLTCLAILCSLLLRMYDPSIHFSYSILFIFCPSRPGRTLLFSPHPPMPCHHNPAA